MPTWQGAKYLWYAQASGWHVDDGPFAVDTSDIHVALLGAVRRLPDLSGTRSAELGLQQPCIERPRVKRALLRSRRSEPVRDGGSTHITRTYHVCTTCTATCNCTTYPYTTI